MAAVRKLAWAFRAVRGPGRRETLELTAGYPFFPENNAPSLDSRETQADLSQGLECSGKQEGDSALTQEVIQSGGEETKPSGYQDTSEDERSCILTQLP